MGSVIRNKIILVLFSAMCLGACQSAEGNQASDQQTKKIIVYGLHTCDHCTKFKAQLDSLGFAYDFHDMENNDVLTNELIDKIQAARIVGQISYPVVDIEGKILITPDLSEVLALMN